MPRIIKVQDARGNGVSAYERSALDEDASAEAATDPATTLGEE